MQLYAEISWVVVGSVSVWSGLSGLRLSSCACLFAQAKDGRKLVMTLENRNRELSTEMTELRQEQQLMVGAYEVCWFLSVRKRHLSGP